MTALPNTPLRLVDPRVQLLDESTAVAIGYVPLDLLNIDHTYQRTIDGPPAQASIKRMVELFDDNRLGTLTVSARDDGQFMVVDGQHRVAACRIIGPDDRPMPCMIHFDMNVADEANLFAGQDRGRRRVSAYEKHRAGLVAGDPVDLAIDHALKMTGFHVQKNRTPLNGGIGAVAELRSIVEATSGGRLQIVLRFFQQAWGSDVSGLAGHVIEGTATFVRLYYNEVDRTRLVEVLGRTSPETIGKEGIEMSGAMGEARYLGVGRVIVRRYNKQLKPENRLPEWDVVADADALANRTRSLLKFHEQRRAEKEEEQG